MLSHIPNVVSLPSHPAAWTSLQNITIAARQEHTTFFLPPSTIGILGGIVPNGTAYSNTDLMQFYSLPRDTWETAAPIPKPLNHVNVAVANGKIYLLGGLANALDGGSWQAIPDSWVYDPKKNAWEEIDAMPTAEARGSATMGVYEGKIFLAGGMRTLVLRQDWLQDTVDTVSVYDTTNGKWIAVPDAAKKMPEGRDHAGGAVIGDKMYVLGGRNRGQLNVRDTVFILNLCNLQAGWTTSKAKLPTPRGGLAAGVIGKKVYTFGGEGNLEVESGVFNQTEVYDTVTDSWERLGPMKVPRHGTSAVGVENKVYIPGGGVLIGGGPVATFDAFVP
ncbi:galactose oxidase [Zopfia rhizophila CBS 207.26]|uniref:Galactose oxidase n=1 Tax=Zopfia rhizophila CBS 207.26 TaxID=1314779 RepID=A0A6A6E8G2_9PEZI|nr:galactose oxidase [Zopfia rhizophila CBS 207.26]